MQNNPVSNGVKKLLPQHYVIELSVERYGMQAYDNVCIPYKENSMYFNAELEVENHIYLIERLSGSLISIHIPSGKTKIEVYLPWKYTETKMGMLSWNHIIFIYSPVMDHFLAYDGLKQQIRIIKLQGIEADKAGFYHSNVLIDQGDFIVLPFKRKAIERYGINGELKSKDEQWCFDVAKECGFDENLFGNIRVDSACIAEGQLFFSLIYGNQNYLCRYELNQEEHLCSVVYRSEDIAIRGVYAYPNTILFRRIFPDKTEIVLIALDSYEQKTIRIDFSSTFEEDVYGDMHCLRASFKNKILKIEESDLNLYKKIYDFGREDVYIASGVLFNAQTNEVLIPDVDYIKKYSIEKTVKEIKNGILYQEGCRKLFGGRCMWEERYKLKDLTRYLTECSSMEIERKNFIKNRSIGKRTWETIQ